MARILVNRVGMAFGSRVVLRELNLDIAYGEFVTIVGLSGCGKTTLLNLLAGLLLPTSGDITVDGVPIKGPGPARAVVFQDAALLPWRTVLRNVELGLEMQHRFESREIKKRALDHLEMVGLKDFGPAHPAELSQGMRQRVALARMLVTEPTTLLMDEPFSALDAQTRLLMHLHFLSIWERLKSTVLLITHDLGEAITLADRVIVFSRSPGRIKGEYRIDLPRPRRVADLQANAHYHDLFRKIWEILEEELVGASDRI